MKKLKKILIILLSFLFVASTAIGLVGCAGDDDLENIETLEPKVTYRVLDSIYVYDLFKWKDGQNLTFSYTVDGGESAAVSGEFVFLKVEGLYAITATLSEKNSKTVEINVTNPLSRMSLEHDEITVDFEAVMGVRTIINKAVPVIKSSVEHNEFVEKVWIYKDGEDADPLIYDIVEGEAGVDGMFDGKRFTFRYECDYVFRVYSETSGGRVYYDLTVHCIEDLSRLEDLSDDYDFEFNTETHVGRWDAVENATAYRVKFAGQTKVITQTEIDISEYLVKDWYHFNFAVIPVDKDGEKLGKFVREDFIKAPENSKDVILGRGVTSIDGDQRQVTLNGYEAIGPGYRTEIHTTLNNSYIAFCNSETGKYGVGTVAEFTFKGNNMPQLCFFADKLNGDITEYGGAGWLLLNGLYTKNKHGQSNSTTNVVAENSLVLLGPNRIDEHHQNYVTVAEQSGAFTVSKNSLFTQKYLRETPDTEYRYKVRTFDKDGYLTFEAILEDASTGEIVAGPSVKTTSTLVSNVKPGYIIAYATVKGSGNNTTFNYKLPYDYVDYSDPNCESFGAIFTGENTVFMSAGTHKNVSSMQGSTWGPGWISGIADYVNNYVGYANDWSVGKAVDLTFIGNNMPIITLFANSVGSNMSGSSTKDVNNVDQNGYLISNGIYNVVTEPDSIYGENTLIVYGPNRISANLGANQSNVTTIGGKVYNGLVANVKYKLTVGTAVENEKVIIVLELKNAENNQLISMGKYLTNKTESEVNALGSGIIFYAGVKGNGEPTTFTYSEFYDYTFSGGEFDLFGGSINPDGSVTLQAGRDTGISYGGAVQAGWSSGIGRYTNNYIAFKNVAEVGNYVDFYFTGDNMPQVTLFADKVNAILCADLTPGGGEIEQNGYLIANGIYQAHATSPTMFGENSMYVYGPNRISANLNSIDYTNSGIVCIDGAYSGLNATTNYKYTVGSQVLGGKVVIVLELYNADKSQVLYRAYYPTNKTETEVEALGSHLIAYAGVKGVKDNEKSTTFKYSAVYASSVALPIAEGATFNANGTVTLAAGNSGSGQFATAGHGSGASTYKNSYVAFENASQVGDYIDFYFTGNNMPQVTLFAKVVNSCMGACLQYAVNASTEKDNYGYLIANGIKATASQTESPIYADGFLYAFGPNRIDNHLSVFTNSNLTTVSGAYTGLTDGTNYKYTVGSKLVSDKVVIEVLLYTVEGTTETLVYSATYATNKTETEVEAVGSHIIAYAGVKGNGINTTFKYSDVYTKNA